VSVSIKPLEDRIVIKQLEAEQVTASGLVIPDTAKEKPQEGEVVAVGPGRIDDNGNRVPLDVVVGDKVIYSKYGGTEIKYGGDDLLILPKGLAARPSGPFVRSGADTLAR
jgi:chaperonin GroES